ncbi:MAG TPA: hypothetical protein IGS52_13125 [Oscillatoriaceae cyanobacterium M33_DOE_052]|uniref:Filament integrity protein fraC n=1 Tax=Planktothricoides sp. SpSt-374 TaxID=2282167 RepID=A0A7C3VHX0_9CYAN|nr:hypothetical protein [Oscillatoriaceae cyanobacterium M33_DOE_052]
MNPVTGIEIPYILPLRAFLLQALCLLVAIAAESYFFHSALKLTRKNSIAAAATTNLFAAVIGWLIFFYIAYFLLDLIPALTPIKHDLAGYIFLNQYSPLLGSAIILVATTIFIILLFFKIYTIKFMSKIQLLGKEAVVLAAKKRQNRYPLHSVVLWAHSCSNTLILTILFLVNWVGN